MDVISKRISLTAWGRLYGFNKATTSRLHRQGKLPPGLQIEQLPNGRYYVIVPPEGGARCVLYASVSSADQRGDLDRQAGRLAEWATQHDCRPDEVVKEIGSGLNGNRRQLRRIIGDPSVGTIIVEHRERLCRFGFEYIEAALSARGARILVVDDGEVEDDLVRDATEVMTSLCARLYGKRSARRRAERAVAAAGETLMQATYQTRIEGNDEALSAYAALYGRVQRRLFAEVSSGRSAASRSAASRSMKRGCVREYGIPARMFNAVRVSLERKVSGARESQLLHIETLKGMVRRAGKELANAGKKGDRHRVHIGAGRGRYGGGPGPAVLRRQEALARPVQPGGQRLRQP